MLKVNDICYIIENCNTVSKVEIIAIYGEFYTVKFLERPRPSAAKLRHGRLYITEEEAQTFIEKKADIIKTDIKIGTHAQSKSNWPCQEHKH